MCLIASGYSLLPRMSSSYDECPYLLINRERCCQCLMIRLRCSSLENFLLLWAPTTGYFYSRPVCHMQWKHFFMIVSHCLIKCQCSFKGVPFFQFVTVSLVFSVCAYMCNANVHQWMHMRGIVLGVSLSGGAWIDLRHLYSDELYMDWSLHFLLISFFLGFVPISFIPFFF